MGWKEIFLKSLRRPNRIFGYLWWRSGLRKFYRTRVIKRVPFDYMGVSTWWGVGGAGLPHFASRLYREVKLLQKALRGVYVEKSLEVGCGYGRLTPWIMEHSQEHYAVEPEKKLLKDAEALNPKAKFYNAKAQNLPFPDGFFDLCVTWTVLQHVPPNELGKALAEIKRVMKKTGIIVATEGVGLHKGENVWFYAMEDWKRFFKPWVLTQQFERILEETAGPDEGIVMRFEMKT